MSAYRVEQSDEGWYVMCRGACWASCSGRADAERIARALAVLDAMERGDVLPSSRSKDERPTGGHNDHTVSGGWVEP